MTAAARMRASNRNNEALTESVGIKEWFKQKQKYMSALAASLMLASIIGFLALIGDKVLGVFDHDITSITIQGQFVNLDKRALESSLSPWIDSSFFGADLSEIKALVEDNAWVHSARITRVWPGQLLIEVEEQVPSANWGTDAYLNPEAEIFTPKQVSWNVNRPMVQGPENSTQAERQELLAKMYTTQSWLAERGLGLDHLSLDDRGTWRLGMRLMSANGTQQGPEIELGAAPFMDRLDRAVRAYLSLASDAQTAVASIDTRYPNGVAVAWKDVALAAGQGIGQYNYKRNM